MDRRGRWSVEEKRQEKHREAREEGDAEQSRAEREEVEVEIRRSNASKAMQCNLLDT